jgi:hypothetical protein
MQPTYVEPNKIKIEQRHSELELYMGREKVKGERKRKRTLVGCWLVVGWLVMGRMGRMLGSP